MSRVVVDRPFDAEKIIHLYPGALSFAGAPASLPGRTVISGDFDYDAMMRALDRAWIDNGLLGESTIQMVVRRRLAVVSGIALFLGGTITGALGVMLFG